MEETKKVTDLVKEIETQLKADYPDPLLRRQYAWWTLETILLIKKETLIAQETITLTDEQRADLDVWIDRLVSAHMPIQYLIGSIPFCNLDILVEPPILIPRPETEEWVCNLIDQLNNLDNTALNILDIGAGSGCIALALAKALPKAKIYATDIADEALALAQKNASHNTIKNITFIKSDVFKSISKDINFDLIVSNPPYIAPDEWQSLDASVTKWEDKRALVAEHEGLAIIERIVTQASNYLKSNAEMASKKIPQLILEIGYMQGKNVVELMKKAGFMDITLIKDLQGKDRAVSGRIKNVANSSLKL